MLLLLGAAPYRDLLLVACWACWMSCGRELLHLDVLALGLASRRPSSVEHPLEAADLEHLQHAIGWSG
jgi:hypothetical protein